MRPGIARGRVDAVRIAHGRHLRVPRRREPSRVGCWEWRWVGVRSISRVAMRSGFGLLRRGKRHFRGVRFWCPFAFGRLF